MINSLEIKDNFPIRRKESIYYRSLNFDKMWNDIFDGGDLEELFVQYCKDWLCIENILFYRQAASYKLLRNSTSRKLLASEIWSQFLEKDSEYEINITDKMWQGKYE